MKHKQYLYSCLLLCLSVGSQAQQDSIVPFEMAYKRVYPIHKISGEKPVIDGKLDEDLWRNQGEWSERFVQIIPYERVLSDSPTRVKLFYDDKNIYVGVYCKDAQPEKMNRFIGNRDDNSLGDLVSVARTSWQSIKAGMPYGNARQISTVPIRVGRLSSGFLSASCAIISFLLTVYGACTSAESSAGTMRCRTGV